MSIYTTYLAETHFICSLACSKYLVENKQQKVTLVGTRLKTSAFFMTRPKIVINILKCDLLSGLLTDLGGVSCMRDSDEYEEF